jgi:hypothetical protein
MVNDAFSTVREDVLRIGKAVTARNYWSVLAIPPGSDYQQIKAAHRKWIRRLHPDRWFATTDAELYQQIHEAFYQVQVAYFEALKLHASKQTEAAQNAPIVIETPVESVDIPLFSWLIRLLQKTGLGFFGQKEDTAR